MDELEATELEALLRVTLGDLLVRTVGVNWQTVCRLASARRLRRHAISRPATEMAWARTRGQRQG
jgi:hypothetical protein